MMTQQEVLRALADGKAIQRLAMVFNGVAEWKDPHGLNTAIGWLSSDSGRFDETRWRIKPEPKRVPLNREQCIGAWFRNLATGTLLWPLAINTSGLYLYSATIPFIELMSQYEMSFDGGKTFVPCYKEVTE
jgi:hypothetical protein